MAEVFTAFNFAVSIMLGDRATDPLCQAAFAECGGLELAMDVTTIREGGNNAGPVHLAGPVSSGTLTLKRGMSSSFDLWTWFERVARDDGRDVRAACEVEMLGADRSGPVATFVLTGCLPTKIKAPALDALSGLLAVEEMEIAYETLSLRPGGGPRA